MYLLLTFSPESLVFTPGYATLYSLRIVKPGAVTIWALAGVEIRRWFSVSLWMQETLNQQVSLSGAMNGGRIAAGVVNPLTSRLQMLGVPSAFFQSEFGTHTHRRRRRVLCLCVFFICVFFIVSGIWQAVGFWQAIAFWLATRSRHTRRRNYIVLIPLFFIAPKVCLNLLDEPFINKPGNGNLRSGTANSCAPRQMW
jgi:hypothetical protein